MSSDRCAIMTTGGGSMPFAATFRAFRRRASLNVCLRRLEKSGLVTRRVLTTGRLGVEYAFTELGRTLERPVAALFEWTKDHGDIVRAAQAAFEATAGGERHVE